ncbi:MAG: type II secretion system F family protein [Anaerolineales bacterium]|jgi:tight adherence protein C|nr:type II secretion system F family protein [Anaerolineales bacterium]
MTETLRLIAPFLGAGTLALVVSYLVANLRIRPKIARGLEDFYASAGNDQRAASRGEQIGNRVAQRLPFSLDTWEEHLQWAQRGGYFRDWGIGRLVFTAMIYAGIGGLVLLVNPAPVSLLVPLGAAAYPFISVRAKANTVRKRVVRGLPEVAALVAAEMSAGVSPEQAVQRAAVLPGPLTSLLSEVLTYSRSAGRPLFRRRPVRGALVEVFSQADLPELLSFAAQLDLVAEKGVAGAILMNEVARTLGREYRSRLDSEVEKLNGRLMLATAVFFFIPFVLVILGSFMAPVMAIFG